MTASQSRFRSYLAARRLHRREILRVGNLIATVYHALGVPRDQTLKDLDARPRLVRPGMAIQALLA